MIKKMAGRGHDQGSMTSYVERMTFISPGHVFNARTSVTIATLDTLKNMNHLFVCLFIQRFDYRKRLMRLMFSVDTVLCDGQGGCLLTGFVC